MTTERWRRIEELFLQAIDLPDTERPAFLDRVCQGDAELRREIESLLTCDAPEERLVELPPTFTMRAAQAASDGDLSGRSVGPYRILRLIGHGGMGSVYLGSRSDHYRKEVAIKVLKRGMDTDFMLKRFRQERQILAGLDHPFIARLLGGGATDDGLPYFVMEYVDGVPVTQYCDAQHTSLPERIRLFQLICEAVHYAHQNLVVHRDIKPSNILVTNEGSPKLLDFGIAKVIKPDLTQGVTLTRPGLRMLTPDYASPEHVKGSVMTTASDIYSLGAVLYEMTTGCRPHRFKSSSASDLERAVCEADPEKPSIAVTNNDEYSPVMKRRLQRELSGDLDNIILTAMCKDPLRRYSSAAEFSADLQRYMEGFPISAQEHGLWYSTAKFLRRHKLGLAALVLVVATLVGGIVASTVQARRAERRFQLVRGLANSLLFEIHDEMAKVPGSTALQASTVRTVMTYLDRVAEDHSRDDELDLEIANAYERAAGLEGHPYRSNLGRGPSALTHFRKALAIYERLVDRPSVRNQAIRGLIDTHLNISGMEAVFGRPVAAEQHFSKASALADKIFTEGGYDIPPTTQVNVYDRLADAKYQRGDARGEAAQYGKAVEISKAWYRASGSAEALSQLRSSLQNLASSQARSGDLAAARDSYQKALTAAQELFHRTDASQEQRYNIISLQIATGDILNAPDDPNFGDRAGAISRYRAALAIAEEFVNADRQNVNARRNLAACYRRLGMMYVDNSPVQGLDYYNRSLAIAEDLAAGDPANIEYQYAVSRACMGVGQGLHNLHREAEAIQNLSRAIEIQKRIVASSPERTWNVRILSRTYSLLGDALLGYGDADRAFEAHREALAQADRILQRAPGSLYHELDRADVLEATGKYYLALAARPGLADPRREALRQQARTQFEGSLAVWQSWIKRQVGAPYAVRREAQAIAAIASTRSHSE